MPSRSGPSACHSTILACLIVLLLALAPAPGAAADAPPAKIRLQLKWTHQFQFAGYYAALEKGYFKEAGLDVEIQAGGPAINAIEVVTSGNAEYGVGNSSLVLERAKGRNVVSLAVIMQHSPLALLKLKRTGTDHVHSLIGQRIILEPNSDELLAFLRREGVKQDQIDILPHVGSIATLLQDNAAAMSVYTTTELYELEKSTFAYSLLSPRSAGIDFYGDTLFTSEQEARNHPEQVAAFTRASLLGWKYAMSHPEEIADLILKRYGSQRSKPALLHEYEQMKPLILPDLVPIGFQYAGRWQHIADVYSELGMLPKGYQPQGLVYSEPEPWLKKHRVAVIVAILASMVLGGISWFFIYITRRLKAQMHESERLRENLQRSELQSRMLLESAPFPIVVTRLSDGRVEYVNKRAAEMFGAPQEEIINHPAAESYVHQDQRTKLIEMVMQNGRVLDYEIDIQNISGEVHPILLSCYLSAMNDKPVLFAAFSDITRQKKAEWEIGNREWQLRRLLEEAPISIVICRGENQAIHYINRRAASTFELTQEESNNRLLAVFFTDKTDLQQIDSLRDQTGWVHDFETRIKTSSGRELWVLVSSQLGEMDGCEVVFFTFSDISLRKEAEEAIARSEQEMRLLLDRAPTPITITRLSDSAFMYANLAAKHLLGIDSEKLEGLYGKDFYVNPQDRNRLLDGLRKDGFVSDLDILLKTPHTPRLWTLFTAGPTLYQRQSALMITLTDISERKRMDEIMRESEERFRFLAENTADVVWQMDRNLRITYINESDERLRGVPREQVIGQHASMLSTPEHAQRQIQQWKLRMEQEAQGVRTGTHFFEAEQVRADGSTFWVEVSSTPQRNKQGEITSFIGITRDITERKKAEQALERFNQQLAEQLEQIQSLQAALQEQVIRDSLTGLFNRRYMDESFERELARARREGYPVAIAVIDIDHFKQVNDTYGHQAGDEVLRVLGKLLLEHTRQSDIPCRFGGEEFLLVLPNIGLEDARERVENLRTRFAADEIHFGQFTIRVTLSIGLAAYPTHGLSPHELTHSADEALYTAKHNGRNQVVVAPSPSS